MLTHIRLTRLGAFRLPLTICLAAGICCFACRHDDTRESAEPAQKTPLGRGLNVLLVSVDTTRADHLGCYGHSHVKTPNIDRLAAEGVLFEQCISSCPVTLPSHSTMFTGLYSFVHGARDNGIFKLAPENVTLAELFQDADYATHAQIAAHVLDEKFGLDQGFDTYTDVAATLTTPGGDLDNLKVRSADEITRAGIQLLEENREQKFFIFLHYFDPHHPYEPPEPYASEYADPYAGEIAFFDHEFGKLMSALQDLDLAEKTLVILTSDHGEALGEHDEATHAFFVYDATLRVPLILSCPGLIAEGATIKSQVRLLDLAPTIADFAGLDMPDPVQGRSLLPLLEDGRAGERPCYGESLSGKHTFGYSALRFLRTGGWKYIHSPDPELYHVALDPGELRDLIDTEPARAAAMKEQLRTLIEQSPDPPASRATRRLLSSEDIARLQALGYLSSGSEVSGNGTEIDDFEPHGHNPRDRLDVINAMTNAVGLFLRGDATKSELLFRWVLDREPGNVQATRGLLYSLLEQMQPGEAVRSLRQLAEADPDSEGLRAVAGTFAAVLISENELDEAVSQFRVALEEKPDDARLLEGLAMVLVRLGNDDEACGVYEHISRIEPGRPGTYSRWSILLHKLGRPAEGLEVLRRGLRARPNDPYLANNLAFHLATSPEQDLRDGEEAVRLAELANQLANGKHVNLLSTLGAAYASAGRFEEAIAASQQALELARESNDEANINRALDAIERYKRGESMIMP